VDNTLQWVPACKLEDVLQDDIKEVIHGGKVLAVYRLGDQVYATDGLCTHEEAPLADGFVIDGVIECPLHQGRFDVRSGKPLGGPVCIALRTYPARTENGVIMIGMPAGE
jgi:3-phenylpropionate/trans-cinnamate dioxygenase ferredoxin component